MSRMAGAMKHAFHTMLDQFGQTVRVYTDFGNSKDAVEYRGLKSTQEKPPHRTYIKFKERVGINVGDHLSLKAGSDIWRVVEVEDVTSGDEFIAFQVFIEKTTAAQPAATSGPVFHAPIYGGVQVGGNHNSQNVEVTVDSRIQLQLEELAAHIASSNELDEIDKMDGTDALRILGRLSTNPDDAPRRNGAREKISTVERVLGGAANLTTIGAPAIATIRNFFGI